MFVTCSTNLVGFFRVLSGVWLVFDLYYKVLTPYKNEVFHKGLLQEILPNPQFRVDSVTFTEEILCGKLHFLCNVIYLVICY